MRLGSFTALIVFCAALLLAVPSADAKARRSASDPSGDVRSCSGECSNYNTDLKHISLSRSGKRLVVKVSQWGSFAGAQPLYWPQLEIYTKKSHSHPKQAPEAPWKTSHPADYSVFVGYAPGGYEMDLLRKDKKIAVVKHSKPSTAITYYVPLAKLGHPAHVWVRAWQAGTDAKAIDVAPDQGKALVSLGVSGGAKAVASAAKALPYKRYGHVTGSEDVHEQVFLHYHGKFPKLGKHEFIGYAAYYQGSRKHCWSETSVSGDLRHRRMRNPKMNALVFPDNYNGTETWCKGKWLGWADVYKDHGSYAKPVLRIAHGTFKL